MKGAAAGWCQCSTNLDRLNPRSRHIKVPRWMHKRIDVGEKGGRWSRKRRWSSSWVIAMSKEATSLQGGGGLQVVVVVA